MAGYWPAHTACAEETKAKLEAANSAAAQMRAKFSVFMVYLLD
jgi:hypothetical protein